MLSVRDGAFLMVAEGGRSSMLSGRSAGIVRGRAAGRASALRTAGVTARGAAGSAPGAGLVASGPPLSLWAIYLIVWVIWLCCHGRANGVSVLSTQESAVVLAATVVALFAMSQALSWG